MIPNNTKALLVSLHFCPCKINFPPYESKNWILDKTETLPARGFHCPNLPWMADGDLKLTQSLAIFKHLASKHNLMVKPEEVATLCMCEVNYINLILFKQFYL